MVAGILEKSKRLRKALFFIVKKLPMSGAAERCDLPAECGALMAAALLSCLKPGLFRTGAICCDCLENTTGRPQGQSVPADAVQGVRQSEFVIFRASFLRPFPSRLPAEQCPSFPAGLARD